MRWEMSVDVDVNIYIASRMMRHGFLLVRRHIVIVHAISRRRMLRSKSLILLIIFIIT